jgi:hypothetical protein
VLRGEESSNIAGALHPLLMMLHDLVPDIFALGQSKAFRPNQGLVRFRKIFVQGPFDPKHERGYLHVI